MTGETGRKSRNLEFYLLMDKQGVTFSQVWPARAISHKMSVHERNILKSKFAARLEGMRSAMGVAYTDDWDLGSLCVNRTNDITCAFKF